MYKDSKISMENQQKVLVVDRRWCEHCDQGLSLKTYKAHRRLYYNQEREEWLKKRPGKRLERHSFKWYRITTYSVRKLLRK